jgi:ferredoxin-NADP reductase
MTSTLRATPVSRRRRLCALAEALTTPHRLDRYLELVNPMATVADLRARITGVRRCATGSLTLTLRPTRQWAGHEAGQFVQVSVVIDGVRHTRCYSPTDSQARSDGRISITVKAHPHGLVSQHLHRHARIGMVVGLSQADGVFRLPRPRPGKIVLISAGSGITPVLSMLRTLADEGYHGQLAFLHYATGPDAVPHRAELAELAARCAHATVGYGYPGGESGDVGGYFGGEHLDRLAPWYREAHTFLCGPPALRAAVRELYGRHGLADRLHTEEFVTPFRPAREPAEGAVTFSASAVQAANTGASLLEQAEAAGLRPEHGCRMGICFSCTAVKTSGCTRDLRTGALDRDPGHRIQLCVNAPVGDVAIEI